MKQAFPRTTFNSSQLIRSLSALRVAEVVESKQPLAERLGQWLGVADAMALFAVLNPGTAGAVPAPARVGGDSSGLADELAQVRAVLTRSIRAMDLTELAAQARIESPPPKTEDAGSADALSQYTADFFPYRRQYLGLQRTMAISIEALRGKVRASLAGRSARLKQLAALDAGLEQALALRERDLLGAIPSLLERRFEQLREAYRQGQQETQTRDDPALWTQPGGWLAAFHADLQSVMQAELELRLRPLTGLIEAHGNEGNNEVTKSQ